MSAAKKISAKKRRRVFIGLAISLGFLGALIFSEIALRVYVASRGWTPNCYVTHLALLVPDSDAGYSLRKNTRLKSSGCDIRINSLGLRGPEISEDKRDHVTRIAVLGGSSVFGYLVPEGEDSCRVMEEILRERGVDAEVINAGVNGYSMTQCRHRYEQVVAPLRPDFVILYLGWNDTLYLIQDADQASRNAPSAPSLTKRVFSKSTLYGLLRYRLFPEKNPVFAAPESSNSQMSESGKRQFRDDFKALVKAVEESGAVPVVSTQVMATSEHCEGLDWHLGSTSKQIAANQVIGRWIVDTEREIAADNQLLLIDCTKEVPCSDDTLGDPIHLTKKGHRLVAELWVQGLMPLLKPSNIDDADEVAP
ncbi:SGNH/GDSL hydrolase family protein [Novipirellula sp. SH528]|uniref:SGNH/GDSL hydrolase family protein n=1 Tax=Novipirellula sp. SH528 TaxID=3454466 RepID=UPI003FA10C77